MFLEKKTMKGNDTYFYGFKLVNNGQFSFTDRKRRNIIHSIINHVNIRINFDSSMQTIGLEVQQEDAKCCHSFIASDYDENAFLREFGDVAELLKDRH